jgi:hypothetical protein
LIGGKEMKELLNDEINKINRPRKLSKLSKISKIDKISKVNKISEMPPILLKKPLGDIKNHVVQIENMILAAILFTALLSLKGTLDYVLGVSISLLLPFAFLAIIPIFVRVTNPPSRLRSILTWGMSGAGTGGLVGGGIAGVVTGGTGAAVGALIGAPIGFAVGALAGVKVDKTPDVMTQGEAREYLVKLSKEKPDLNMRTIVDATEYPPIIDNDCNVYMFQSDGTIKCTKEDVHKWFHSECWKKQSKRIVKANMGKRVGRRLKP